MRKIGDFLLIDKKNMAMGSKSTPDSVKFVIGGKIRYIIMINFFIYLEYLQLYLLKSLCLIASLFRLATYITTRLGITHEESVFRVCRSTIPTATRAMIFNTAQMPIGTIPGMRLNYQYLVLK